MQEKRIKVEFSVLSVIVLVALMLMLIIPNMIASSYTVIQPDEYGNATVYEKTTPGGIGDSIKFAAWCYMNVGGASVSHFLQNFLSPLSKLGSDSLKVTMPFMCLLFYFSLFSLIVARPNLKNSFAKNRGMLRFIAALLIIFCMTSYRSYQEAFYWFTGATAYSLPLSFLLLTLAMMVCIDNKSDKSKRTVSMTVVAVIFALIGCGGTITASGTVCYVALIIGVYYFLRDRKVSIPNIAIFATLLAGCVIYIVAPGNYVRLESSGNEVNILVAIKNTFAHMYTEYYWLFHNTNFIFIALIFVAVGILSFSRIEVDLKKYSILTVMLLATPFVTVFPLVLGYGCLLVPNRCMFICETFMIVSVCNMFFTIGKWIASYFNERETRLVIVMLGITFVSLIAIHNYSLEDMETYRTIKLVASGELPEYNNRVEELQECIASAKGTDLAVSITDIPVGFENFANFYLEDGWVNNDIAKFYGLNSLSLED